MRRRWKTNKEELLMAVGLLWIALVAIGAVVFIAVGSTTEVHNELSTAGYVTLGFWGGTIALGVLAGAGWAIWKGTALLLKNMPRHEWESVTEDAREAHRRERD